MNHGDTEQCIACHPTQFTTRGYLTAISHGYPPTQRPALEFLTDRIYNNQRPLYGEPGTDWVRVIYTARTVASRLPLIDHMYEANVTHDAPRTANFEIPYGNFLKIHYKDRTQMPRDEADGCEPDVSPFEIASQSWDTFNNLYRETSDQQWLGYSARAAPSRSCCNRFLLPTAGTWQFVNLPSSACVDDRKILDIFFEPAVRFLAPGIRGKASGLIYSWQTNVDPTFSGLVHSGSRFVLEFGKLIIALGPAFCSPLKGVSAALPLLVFANRCHETAVQLDRLVITDGDLGK